MKELILLKKSGAGIALFSFFPVPATDSPAPTFLLS